MEPLQRQENFVSEKSVKEEKQLVVKSVLRLSNRLLSKGHRQEADLITWVKKSKRTNYNEKRIKWRKPTRKYVYEERNGRRRYAYDKKQKIGTSQKKRKKNVKNRSERLNLVMQCKQEKRRKETKFEW